MSDATDDLMGHAANFERGGEYDSYGLSEKKTAAQLRAMIEEAQSLLQKMENFPEEPEQDLAVIEVQFNGYGRVYTYAALRVDRGWYVTGVSGLSKVSWYEVMEFFDGRNAGILKIEPAVRISDVRNFV